MYYKSIPVTDRLPELGKFVCVLDEAGEMSVYRRTEFGWNMRDGMGDNSPNSNRAITHWLELYHNETDIKADLIVIDMCKSNVFINPNLLRVDGDVLRDATLEYLPCGDIVITGKAHNKRATLQDVWLHEIFVSPEDKDNLPLPQFVRQKHYSLLDKWRGKPMLHYVPAGYYEIQKHEVISVRMSKYNVIKYL